MGVGLNASGALVKGAGASGIIGVLVLTRAIKAGQEPVDIMKRGEIQRCRADRIIPFEPIHCS